MAQIRQDCGDEKERRLRHTGQQSRCNGTGRSLLEPARRGGRLGQGPQAGGGPRGDWLFRAVARLRVKNPGPARCGFQLCAWSLIVKGDGGLKAPAAFIQTHGPGGRLRNVVPPEDIERGGMTDNDSPRAEFHG